MSPIPETFLETPTRRPKNYGKLVSISTTNKLRFKPRSFKIPKCNRNGRKNLKKIREQHRSPLFVLEDEYREFSKSLDDLRPRQADGATRREETPAVDIAPSTSSSGISRRFSDAECDYSPFYHQDNDCNCRDCERGVPVWSDDSDDEDSSFDSKNQTKKEDLDSRMNQLTIHEATDATVDSNDGQLFPADFGIDLNAIEGDIAPFDFDLEAFGEANLEAYVEPNLVPEVENNNLFTLDFDLDGFGDISYSEMEIPDFNAEIQDIQIQVQNLNFQENGPRRVFVSITEPIDELIIDLFPHETIESLFPDSYHEVTFM